MHLVKWLQPDQTDVYTNRVSVELCYHALGEVVVTRAD